MPLLAHVHASTVLLLIVAGVCALQGVIFFFPQLWWRRDTGGQAEKGLVLWVEPLRFLGIRWGERSAAAGLRRAGFRGEFRYWEWHGALGGTLLAPVLRNRRLIETAARRLADFIVQYRTAHPERPLVVIGYSAGGFLVARALELLPEGVTVDAAGVFSSTFSPWHDLRPAAEHVRGRLVVTSSLYDFVILGLGVLLTGGADGRHTPAIGMLGYLGPAHARILQRRWRPRLLRHGLAGMHDWSLLPNYFVRFAADLGLGERGK